MKNTKLVSTLKMFLKYFLKYFIHKSYTLLHNEVFKKEYFFVKGGTL